MNESDRFNFFDVGKGVFVGCWSNSSECAKLMQHGAVALLLLAIFVLNMCLFHCSKTDKTGTLAMLRMVSISCLTFTAVNVIPVACHSAHKVAVKFLCISCFTTMGVAFIWMKDLNVGIALLTGGMYGGVSWLLEVLIGTDEHRSSRYRTSGKMEV